MLLWALLALLVPALAYMTVTRPAALYLGAALFWALFALGVRLFAGQLSQGAIGEDGSFRDIYYVVTDRRPMILAGIMAAMGVLIWGASRLLHPGGPALAWMFGAVYAGALVYLYGAPVLLTDLGLPRLTLDAATAGVVSALMGYLGAALFLTGVGGSLLMLVRARR
ncbi:hypothetical protein roselon_02975 [Roseibacterium elongatum DSM 19469]|uniref:Uncharacterized protein n=1 Tax=Roseicyclus elongatus DSM 19469 TaxID=1294273 RepID=W8RVE5_9RHOB|nr:hypothetical protein [Roseibacterium elongatum]AHM05258.1 hypothetical protein roselon_02975 [Roseibacterium elongatum DSM 19469]